MSLSLRSIGAVLAAGVVAATVTSVSAASTASETVTVGAVTARFTYDAAAPLSRAAHLKISQSGRSVFDSSVHSSWCDHQCWSQFLGAGRSVFHVVRLEPGAPPAVVLDLYSGGAHCCSIVQVYAKHSTTGHYGVTQRNFWDPGYRFVTSGPGGSSDFLTADDTFAYAFTDFAASGMPVQVLRFSHGSYRDVTRKFPGLIVRDASQWLHAFQSAASSHYTDTVGVVAAWAADEEMLGHDARVRSFLAAQLAAGHLRSGLSPIQPGGAAFVRALEHFLVVHHYAVDTASAG